MREARTYGRAHEHAPTQDRYRRYREPGGRVPLFPLATRVTPRSGVSASHLTPHGVAACQAAGLGYASGRLCPDKRQAFRNSSPVVVHSYVGSL
jgi:hypothetical protein